ncbi:MAG: ABC transporter permease [Lachnospiraceae bacterium]|nr:ABC transporter permease [Lachnospiraceae bacterium]
MDKEKIISKEKLCPVHFTEADAQDVSGPSLTYAQDVWRRLKKNKLSILGLCIVIMILLLAIFGQFLSKHDYSTQNLSMSNLPPVWKCYDIGLDNYVYIHKEYTLYEVTEKGEVVKRYEPEKENKAMRSRIYKLDGKKVEVDYSGAVKAAALEKKGKVKEAEKIDTVQLKVDGKQVDLSNPIKVRNKSHIFGTDYLGRDLFARVMYGARISLLVALIATAVQFGIGVLYGGIAGYAGGKVDNIMMRIVDIISTVPLTLYVVLLMVVMGPGLKTIMIALGTVYWVDMARLVRGQILTIKNQEYVLAAKTIGASHWRIMVRHLIPNAMGAIIITLTMNIPSAIFTESFLSFIGLGVSAPAASWGTLANDALGSLRTYPYQLFFPALFICLTVLAFNFLGDGLRDALDPKLRK